MILYFCSVCHKTYEDIEKAMKCCTNNNKEWYTIEEAIKILNLNPEEILKELENDLGKYEQIGKSIGQLVDEKNKAYGNSFNESSNFLKILYPNGIQVDQYADMLGIIRVFDKLMRIAHQKDAFGENPWRDIVGYGILRSEDE